MGKTRVLDEGLVGGVEQDQRAVGAGVVHPGFQLLLRCDGSCGVVGKAQVDEVHRFAGDLGREAVVGTDGQISETGIATFVTGIAGATGHHIAVHINGVNRVCDGDLVPGPENVQDVAAVAFGAIGNEDLLSADVTSAGLEVVLGDGLPQPAVTLFRAVAVKTFSGAHLIDG